MARAEYEDIVLSPQGKPLPESPVSIKVHAGAAGSNTLYQAEEGSATISALKTGKSGSFSVWLEEGRYDVTAVGKNVVVDIINQASVVVGSIGAESVTAEKLAATAVTEAKIKNEAVTKGKLSSALQAEITAGAAAKEETLSAHEGVIKLDLTKASVFHAELKGATEFEVTNAPAGPKEFVLLVKQDGVGGHTWSIKSVTWVDSTPTFLTTAGLTYLVPVLVLNAGAEILGQGGIEAIASEGVTSEKIAKEAVTAEKLGPEAVTEAKLKGEAVSGAKIKKETIGTTKIEKESINRAKLIPELSKGLPLETGRTTELSGVTETTIAAVNTTLLKPIIVTLEGTGTVVGVEIKERKSKESFVLKFSAAFTGFVNWVVYE